MATLRFAPSVKTTDSLLSSGTLGSQDLEKLAKRTLNLPHTAKVVFTTRYEGHRAVIDGKAWGFLRRILKRIHVHVVWMPKGHLYKQDEGIPDYVRQGRVLLFN
jgi:hypothetical protein